VPASSLRSPVRAGDRHRSPGLAVEEELQPRVTSRGIDLDDYSRRGEANRLRCSLARALAPERRAAEGEQRKRGDAGHDLNRSSLHVPSFRPLAESASDGKGRI
jgi:hypothetical protein